MRDTKTSFMLRASVPGSIPFAEADANLFDLSEQELRALGIRSLPGSLKEAVDEMAESKLLADTLGEHVFEWFIRNKRAEWRDYSVAVTQLELDRYLPTL